METVIHFLSSYHPTLQAFFAGIFTWAVTAFGSALVFFRWTVKRVFLDWMLGFAAGVMLAASYWSLLAPAIEMSSNLMVPQWFPPALGFFLGGISMRVLDYLIPHLHLFKERGEAEGVKTSWHKSILLVSAITLHNIPEGLAIGVAFGATYLGIGDASLAGALALALGIGIQNFPEGLAVSMPLRKEGFSAKKSFFFGQLSGIVEPFSAFSGALLVSSMQVILPYALSFAAGAMIFVVVEELIPESQEGGNSDLATLGVLIGFVFMMVLDLAFS